MMIAQATRSTRRCRSPWSSSSTCGLFLLQAAPFLMAATIIIYAGAIVVTFLFVIMLAQQEGAVERRPAFARAVPGQPGGVRVPGVAPVRAASMTLQHASDLLDASSAT